jgi:uncharacterized repeat protein (TIGR01451 family)
MKPFLAALLGFGCAFAASGQSGPPTKIISASIMPPGPIAVGQVVRVTIRMSTYSGPPADGFGFLVNYDPNILSFVSNSFYLGAASGPDRQWLTKPDQETAAEGYQPQSYCDGAMPGAVLASLGDMGRHYPPRGTVAQSGFLVSFQLLAINPGTSPITPANYAGTALYNTSHQAIPGAELRGTTILIRDTDIIPEVLITSPSEGAVFHAPDKVVITAAAEVTNGSIAKVEFFADDLPKLGEATNAPYTVNWLYPTAGQHSLLAIATDTFGGMAASPAVQIVANSLPTVAITNPASGAFFTAPGNIAIQASTSDSDGSVARVEFYSGATLLGTDTNAPFAFAWTNVPAGSYTLTARAVDDRGAAAVSSPVMVTVRPNTGPPQMVAAGTSLVSENGPVNGGIDPGENVTIQFRLRNTGGSDTANLVATLQSATGIVTPSGPQTYGVVTAGGPAVSRTFSFAAYGSAGGTITATLQLQDGTNNRGTVSFAFTLGSSQIFANTSSNSIPSSGAAVTYPSTITVAGLTGVVAKVTLTLTNFSHDYCSDVDMLLTGPTGQEVMLMSDIGGSAGVTNVTLVIDDEAANNFPTPNGLPSGTYKPTDNEPGETMPAPAPAGPYQTLLSSFRGTDPNGAWSLYIDDDFQGDAGGVGGWSLAITTFDPVDPVADLALAVRHAPEQVGIGSEVTFAITVTNAGPEEAVGVWLTNWLPAGLSFVSAMSSQGCCSNMSGQVVGDLGSLAAGAAATLTLVATATTIGAQDSVACTGSAGYDFTASNNRVTNTVEVSAIADLAVTLQASPVPVYLNNTLTYTVLVSNAGPYPASGVVLSNTLPAGAAFVSASASQGSCTYGGGTVTASLGALESGAEATVTISCTSPASAGQLTNEATVSAASPLDPVPGNNSARLITPNVHSAYIIIPMTSLLVSEAAPATGGIEAGETVSVCFYLRNIGGANTTNLTATLLAAGGVLSPGGVMDYGVVTSYGSAVGRTNTFTAATNADGVLTATLQLQEGALNLGTVDFYFAIGRQTTFGDSRILIIPDWGTAGLYPSTNKVAGLSGVITMVSATLSNVTHTFLSDVSALLVAPAGQKVMLMSGAGIGASVSGVTLSFDDAATNVLGQYGSVVTSLYRPVNFNPAASLPSPAPVAPYATALSVLNGANPNGEWLLYVADDSGGDQGSIAGWSLELTTAGVVNPPAPLWEFPPRTTNGPASFLLHGRAGDTWQIDASPDLVNWTTILTNTMSTNVFLFTDPAGGSFSSRFYRAVWRP